MASTSENPAAANDAEEHGNLYVQAFNSGDIATLDRMYTEDAISVWEPGNPLSGQARKDALREFIALKPKMTAKLRESHITGDTALLVVDWSIDVTTPEGDQHLTGTGLDVLRRGPDGGWLFAVDNPFSEG
ncbi:MULTISPECIES: YybH family protein [unclassified Streptomyces]|uniref:YybH family protein n=1 Tax=unclassified Streptomyces TaxID=2593676 RepID=UPI00380B7DBC